MKGISSLHRPSTTRAARSSAAWRSEGWSMGLLLAAGLAAGPTEPGNPPFHEALGRRHHVPDRAERILERGVASWYGPGFHGRPTASGERFDMYALTAAHRTLAIPTTVEVTNVRNRRTVIVRINDRGPFLGNRVIDLSYAAARALDLVEVGTGLVEIRSLGAGRGGSRPAPTFASRQPVFLQVGAYAKNSNAERMRARLEASGFDNVIVREGAAGGRRLVRVGLGPVVDRAAHDRLVARLAAIGITDTHLAAGLTAPRP